MNFLRYQVGKLVEEISVANSQDVVDFRNKLKNGELDTATKAMTHKWFS